LPEPLRRLVRELSDPYRPELHYMRGPGPKWRERHPDQLPSSPSASNCGRLRWACVPQRAGAVSRRL